MTQPTKSSIRSVDQLIDEGLVNTQDKSALEQVASHFSTAISPTMLDSIQQPQAVDPIYQQFVPSTAELTTLPQERHDPIGDDAYRALKGLVHRHKDRCLIMPVQVCPVYCRFCFRREKIGPGSEALSASDLDAIYNYLREHPEIWEVILTGGDPLILKPQKLAEIINALNSIDSIDVIRIHTRVPLVSPEKISTELLGTLKQSQKAVYVVIHTNHQQEFTPAGRTAVRSLAAAGISLLSQTVLLKGINDSAAALGELFKTCIRNRIKPYYLHHLDLAKGTNHFRVDIEKGQAIMRDLRQKYSGICMPTYVLDIPGGYGKVPIGPSYLQADGIVIDHIGNTHRLCMPNQN